jgi:two-component system KDP operon response regulator KdpE
VIIHSGYDAEPHKIRALHSGADDYVVKGTGMKELLARAGASIRRSQSLARPTHTPLFEDAVLRVDFVSQRVSLRGRPLELTPTEFRLLETLVSAHGHTFSAEELVKTVWGPAYDTPGLVKWHIVRLRKKLGDDNRKPKLIVTRWGYGYAYERQERTTT